MTRSPWTQDVGSPRGTSSIGISPKNGRPFPITTGTRAHWVRPLRFGSLFYWAVGNAQLRTGLSLTSAAVLVGFAALTLGAAVKAFERQDVH